MNIDKVLSIHQSYSLMKIGALNKQMLIAQYAQSEQISNLNKQIAVGNNIAREIFENQLKEIQHKELIKYYKSLAYSMKEAIELIDKEKDIIFKCFLYDLYSSLIVDFLEDAKNNLEEISDKEYCHNLELKMQDIATIYSINESLYKESDFVKLRDSYVDYLEQQKILEEKQRLSIICKNNTDIEKHIIIPKPIGNKVLGRIVNILWVLSAIGLLLMILSVFVEIRALPGFFLLLFLPFVIPLIILKKKNKKLKADYNAYLKTIDEKNVSLKADIESMDSILQKQEVLLDNHSYKQFKTKITLKYPNWENVIIQLESYFPKIESEKKEILRLDDKFYKMVVNFVDNQSVNLASVQRLYSCGYVTAKKYVGILVDLGIVENDKVVIRDRVMLDEYLNFLKQKNRIQ